MEEEIMSEESLNDLADIIRKVHARKREETKKTAFAIASGFILLLSFIAAVYFVVIHAP